MLETQKWLRSLECDAETALEKLNEELGVVSNQHKDGRVVLNYDQLNSPKTHPVVKECRGLVLHMDDWSVVAKSMNRFFNWGEVRDEMSKFEWDNSLGFHKEDGSLLIVYFFEGEWRINTRGSFADSNIGDLELLWQELANIALPNNFFSKADKEFTYIFELCSRYNKVVRIYDTPQVFLLTTFNDVTELDWFVTESESKRLEIQTPRYDKFDDIFYVQSYLADQVRKDVTFEGIVIRDQNNRRWKLKSPEYVALHYLKNNNVFSYKKLVPVILQGEGDEFLQYLPEIEEEFNKLANQINQWKSEVHGLWQEYKCEKSQKRFAKAVKHHPFSSILFKARKEDRDAVDVFYDSHDLILKKLKGDTTP